MVSFQDIARRHYKAKASRSMVKKSLSKAVKSTSSPTVLAADVSYPVCPRVMVKNEVSSTSFGFNGNVTDENKIEEYLLSSVRDSSRLVYKRYWLRFNKFCAVRKSSMSAQAVSLFLIHLAESSGGKSAALLARSAIKFFFKIKCPKLKSPTDSWLVSRIACSIKKKYSRTVKKAKCMTPDIVKCVVLKLIDVNNCSFKDLRLACFVLFQYFIFGRYDDVASLKKSNIVVLDSGDIDVNVEKAKNIENWNAKSSIIYNDVESRVNPVKIIKDYLFKLHKLDNSNDFLFPSLRATKKGLILLKNAVSYDAMLKDLRLVLDRCGYNGKSFSLHSAKNGAVSHAANSGNCSEEELRKHGRWASRSMPSYYHKLSLAKKLVVSKALSLKD